FDRDTRPHGRARRAADALRSDAEGVAPRRALRALHGEGRGRVDQDRPDREGPAPESSRPPAAQDARHAEGDQVPDGQSVTVLCRAKGAGVLCTFSTAPSAPFAPAPLAPPAP